MHSPEEWVNYHTASRAIRIVRHEHPPFFYYQITTIGTTKTASKDNLQLVNIKN